MAIKILNKKYFNGGISESSKIGLQGSCYFNKCLNIFDEPTQITLLPKTVKVSGETVTDLIKWMVSGTPYDTNKYFYSEGGKIYRETSDGTWSLLRTVANSCGQGFELHDDYIYYTQNTQVGRYGPLSGEATFDDDWQTGLNDTSTTKFAPIKAFKEGLAIGNGNYLGWWDGAIWDQDRLILPPGLNIRSLEVLDEFLVIGTWRGTAITDNEEGYLFFWDGTSTTFNYFIPIPEGGCNALLNSKNRLFSVVGSSGNLFLNYQPFQKIQQLPKMLISNYAEIYPGAVTNWKNISYVGASGATNSTTLEQGVYAWGSKTEKYPEVLNFAFPISTGTTTGTGVKIGAIKGFGNYLYIGWKDGDTYGVDKVTYNGDPYASGFEEGLIFDDETLYGDKKVNVLKAIHLPLATGESVQLHYKINRATNYTDGIVNSTKDSTETRLEIPLNNRRFREFQYKITLATSGTTSPTVTYIGFEFDDLKEETNDY